jgi:hypothetical protein
MSSLQKTDNAFSWGIEPSLKENELSIIKDTRLGKTVCKSFKESPDKKGFIDGVEMTLKEIYRKGGIWSENVDWRGISNDVIEECLKYQWITVSDLSEILRRGVLEEFGEYKTFSQKQLRKWIQDYQQNKSEIINKQVLFEDKKIRLKEHNKKQSDYNKVKNQSFERFKERVMALGENVKPEQVPRDIDLGGVYLDKFIRAGFKLDDKTRNHLWEGIGRKLCKVFQGTSLEKAKYIEYRRQYMKILISRLIHYKKINKALEVIQDE